MFLFHRNILKDAAVDLSQGTTDPAFPLWRLYDGSSVLYWSGVLGTSNYRIQVDCSPVRQKATAFVLHNHNFDQAAEIKIVGVDGSGFPGNEIIIDVTGESLQVHMFDEAEYMQYEIVITGLAGPMAGEISIGRHFEVAAFGGVGAVREGHISNIEYKQSVGGYDVATKMGPARWWQRTDVKITPDNQIDFVEFLEGVSDFLNPFYVVAENGKPYLVRFENEPELANAVTGAKADQYWRGPVNLVQVF